MSNDGLRMNDREREALETISQLAVEDVPRVQESLFVARYLPILASTTPNTDLTPWLEVVGNPYRSADVMNGDRVLFRVPPLFRRMPTKIHHSGRESVSEIVETSKLHAAQHPRAGEIFLDKHLSSNITSMGLAHDDLKDWDAVLVRYGYPSMFGGSKSDVANPGAQPEAKDIFDDGFEEL